MSDSEERDVVGEVIAEDAEGRKIRVISAKDADGKTFVRAADYDALRQQLADVSNERDGLRAFANELVNATYEGGSFDACELQEIAEKHNLVRLIRADDSCGEACACTQYGFPAECYRKNQILCGKPTEQDAQS